MADSAFAKTQYASDEVLDARYFKALDRFDIRFARTMWVFDNVRAGAEVLHLACGEGMLALLKRKGVKLTGVDASAEFALAARRNGYDATFQSEPGLLPFADASFDYVVGLGALGLSTIHQQQVVLTETKRVLRPGGVTLHALECAGGASDTQRVSRFLEFFQHVAYEPRYAICASVENLLDPVAGDAGYDADFVEYMRGLSQKERRAFDIAMGYVFNKVSDLGVTEPGAGQSILVKASDVPLGPFYNEHRDRRALFSSDWNGMTHDGVCLDRSGEAIFDDGWYEPAMLPPIARSMGRHARIKFHAPEVAAISFDLIPRVSDLATKPLNVEVQLNGVRLSAFSLCKQGWLEVAIAVPEKLRTGMEGEFELDLNVDRAEKAVTAGGREISLAVCNVVVSDQ
jgi:ubiquinone/menaquinone biosynthesis C-methylase UbiE